MSVLNWSEDVYLLVLGTLAFASALLGRTARRQPGPAGPPLQLWKELPTIAFWIGPTFNGAPIIARARWRHTRVRRDLRLLAQWLHGPVPTPRGSI
jgi:hypothetical protein